MKTTFVDCASYTMLCTLRITVYCVVTIFLGNCTSLAIFLFLYAGVLLFRFFFFFFFILVSSYIHVYLLLKHLITSTSWYQQHQDATADDKGCDYEDAQYVWIIVELCSASDCCECDTGVNVFFLLSFYINTLSGV